MKRSKVKLTKRMIDAVQFDGSHPKEQDIRWDAEIPGFGLRVYPTGRKSFVLSYRDEAGTKHIMKLGDYPTVTLDKARESATKIRGKVFDGKNPLEERRQARTGITIAELAESFLTHHAEAKLRARTIGEYRRQLHTHIVPRWGSRLAKTIRRADVAVFHSELGERAPTQANRTIAALSKMFSFARARGFLDDAAANPVQGVERFKEKKRDRWVRPGELPRLVEAINDEPNLYARAAIWLFLLTGARRTELLRAKWEDVDLERAELRFPSENTKAGRVHYVPLSAAALDLLSRIPRQQGNPYILAGSKEGHHLVNIDKPWRRIRKAAAIEDVRIHDLRRTVGSWLATHGESLPLIGKVLNHADVKTTAIYARLAEDPARRAMEEHGARIMEAAKGIRVVK